MYFESRGDAGKQLAAKLVGKYRYEDCAVIALSDGAVMVAEQVAASLHCVLTMLLIENIDVPGEGLSFGGVSQSGNFTYNSDFSQGEIDEYTAEYNGYLQEQKRVAFQSLNRLIGDGGTINNDLLRDRNVIVVADGLQHSAILDVVLDFLKPVRTKQLIFATPVASAQVVDKLHVVADELCILDVKQNYVDTDHYYTDNTVPSHEDTIDKINKIILNWR
jgi:predicted phosphoribosyltransferase